MSDPTEAVRRELVNRINAEPGSREATFVPGFAV